MITRMIWTCFLCSLSSEKSCVEKVASVLRSPLLVSRAFFGAGLTGLAGAGVLRRGGRERERERREGEKESERERERGREGRKMHMAR